MIEITATVESLQQAESLLACGVDTLYIGEEQFGLRLPYSFSREEQEKIIELAHQKGKKVTVAVNGIMHPDKMRQLPAYLHFLEALQVDAITVGDPGIVFILRKEKLNLPYIYDGETLVTSARQINFWAKRGAVGAVLSREIPYLELLEMSKQLQVYGEVLVYGATCIHQSKRPLVQNYYNYIEANERKDKERGLFLSEPQKEETHYSIYEDSNGTHIFADNDLNLLPELPKLIEIQMNHWKLDGIFTPGINFVKIVDLFVQAKKALLANAWTEELSSELDQRIQELHPKGRGLDEGFFLLDPSEVK